MHMPIPEQKFTPFLRVTSASAIQILPAIQPVVKSITNFIRSPTWISSLIGQEQHCYTDEELANFATKPDHLTAVRKMNEMVVNSVFSKLCLTHLLVKQYLTQSFHSHITPGYSSAERDEDKAHRRNEATY